MQCIYLYFSKNIKLKTLKNIILILSVLFTYYVHGQHIQDGISTKINKLLTVIRTNNLYYFVGSNGNISSPYQYIEFYEHGFIRATLPSIISTDSNTSSTGENSISINKRCDQISSYEQRDLHITEWMKELGVIDDVHFEPFGDLTYEYIKNGLVNKKGWVSRNGKYAMIDWEGNFFTPFIYDSYGWYQSLPFINPRETVFLNFYKVKNKNYTVVMDPNSGKELFVTKDSLVHYWDAKNHLVKSEKKWILTHNGIQKKVTSDYHRLIGLPTNSSIYTFETDSKYNSFVDKKGAIIPSKYIPITNFHNGYCFVNELEFKVPNKNYYGEVIYQTDTIYLKIINEKFEVIKTIGKSHKYYNSGLQFNKYGLVTVDNNSKTYVMDYNGNVLLEVSDENENNYIKEVHEGVYLLHYQDRNLDKGNFFNQKGEALINEETKRHYLIKNLVFVRDEKGNYISTEFERNFPLVRLDDANKVIESYFE